MEMARATVELSRHTDATMPLVDRAASAITDEDLAFERELQRMENAMPPEVAEGSRENLLTTEQVDSDMLSAHVDGYAPARTLNELRDQAFHAKQLECDSIEASPEVIRYFTKPNYPDDVGYFMFEGIKVWIPGFWATHKHFDGMSVDSRLAVKRKSLGLK